jgi:UDP-N-acetylglucosamine enolpyruvyl transferase
VEQLVEEKSELAARLAERGRDAAAIKAEAESLRAQLLLAQQQLARRTPAQAPAVKVQGQQHAADAELRRRLAALRASPVPPLPAGGLPLTPGAAASAAAATGGTALNSRQRQQHLQHFQQLMGPEPEEEERGKSNLPARGLALTHAVMTTPPVGGAQVFFLPPLKGVAAGRR